ncbi:hypothetical protein KUCAC02_012472, partial [Chaenocephalus aceratus]
SRKWLSARRCTLSSSSADTSVHFQSHPVNSCPGSAMLSPPWLPWLPPRISVSSGRCDQGASRFHRAWI